MLRVKRMCAEKKGVRGRVNGIQGQLSDFMLECDLTPAADAVSKNIQEKDKVIKTMRITRHP